MHHRVTWFTAAVLTACSAAGAHADVLISKKPTHHMSCQGGTCTAKQPNANLSVSDLKKMLARGDVTVNTDPYFVDIEIRDSFSWTSNSKLNLSADNIIVKEPITVAGLGGVSIQTSDRNLDLAFVHKGRLIFWDVASSFAINGDTYMLVNSIAGMATAIAANPGGHFALANNYDASADGTYSVPPVPEQFSGIFDGLGNAIAHFSLIARSGEQDIGLFAIVKFGAIYDLGLPDVHVVGDGPSNIGAIAGTTSASYRTWATGKVTGGNSVNVGGLYGIGGGTGDHFSGKVVGGDVSIVGGIAGVGGGVSSRSDGVVRGGNDSIVGGLAGEGSASYSHSSATVIAGSTITYTVLAGGLIGYAMNPVDHCRASGKVTMGNGTKEAGGEAGGLVGDGFSAPITYSSASGAVHGGRSTTVAGLVAVSRTTLSQSFATGAVTTGAGGTAGGFVGSATAAQDDYSTGAVSGGAGSSVGGFIWQNIANASASYSIGHVSGGRKVGGFAGVLNGQFQNDDWDVDTSGSDEATGDGNVDGVTGLGDAQLKSGLPAGFDPQVWAIDPNINNGYPYLLANPPQ
jgi:hypothetical protein